MRSWDIGVCNETTYFIRIELVNFQLQQRPLRTQIADKIVFEGENNCLMTNSEFRGDWGKEVLWI